MEYYWLCFRNIVRYRTILEWYGVWESFDLSGDFLFVMDNGWSGLKGNMGENWWIIREVRILVGKSVGLDYFENDYHLEWDLNWGMVKWVDFVGEIWGVGMEWEEIT